MILKFHAKFNHKPVIESINYLVRRIVSKLFRNIFHLNKNLVATQHRRNDLFFIHLYENFYDTQIFLKILDYF